ncbi:hypothetical protein MGALJ_19320 [Mycobacterium gallinarum]|uniref:Uncharacterized protein n=1 Tax=Mycobacterium gallinarum TaxID=39689 RepID=A0A9W4B1A8_9MYCO|nr:hypothetical protein MGALJ_19320 [Mycobacterium gallinarum]
MHNQHVGLGSTCDVGRHGTEQAASDRGEADVTDDKKIGLDLFGEIDEGVDGCADDRLLLDVLGTRLMRTFLRLAENRVDGGVARHLVALVLEHVGRALVFALGEVRRRHDHCRA